MKKPKVYYGALARYCFNSDRPGMWQEVEGFTVFCKYSEWNKTIGSYKFVDNGDGTYSSFQVLENGKELPMKVKKTFNRKDLNHEIKVGAFKEVSGYPLATPMPIDHATCQEYYQMRAEK